MSSKDDTNTLQQDLDSLVAWTKLWQMSLSCDRCKILRVYRLRNPIIHQYTMNRTPLDSVSHRPFLGVELSSNLNWSFHIENIKGKANRSLGFIRRNLHSCPENVKSQATSPSFVVVWNTPAMCGTHIVKSIATIKKEHSGQPPDL